jgi:hypothetical protein
VKRFDGHSYGQPTIDLGVAAHLEPGHRECQRGGRIAHLLGRVHKYLRTSGRRQVGDRFGPRVRIGFVPEREPRLSWYR